MKSFDHVVFTEFDDNTGLLVNLNNKNYHQLNETGALIWREFSSHKSEAEIVQTLMAEYEIDEPRAAAAVKSFLSKLNATLG